MKLKKFLKQFCIDEGINLKIDVLIFDKDNKYSAPTIVSDFAGNLLHGVKPENANFELLKNPTTVFLNNHGSVEKSSDPMDYMLSLPVRLILAPKSSESAISIVVEEFEPKNVIYKYTNIVTKITNGKDEIISSRDKTEVKTCISHKKLAEIKKCKLRALKKSIPVKAKINKKKVKESDIIHDIVIDNMKNSDTITKSEPNSSETSK